MMLVPRAFRYSSMQEQRFEVYDEKPKRPLLAKADAMMAKSKSTDPETVPTKPVGIPPRGSEFSQDVLRARSSRAQHESQSAPRPNQGHDPSRMPPSVAALLAMTTIPPPKPYQISRTRNPISRRVSIDELIRDWRSNEPSPSPSLGGDSPLNILLEPPEEEEDENDETSTLCNEQEQDLTAYRSASSDSIPSLSADETSVFSSSNPSTPDGMRSARLFERRAKSFLSPESQSCELDHPLLHLPKSEDDDSETSPTESTPVPSLPTSRRSSPSTLTSTFKSNLTASLLALKSAAKSFSNFTAPSIPADDFLTRSIIYPRFASEMRPKPVDGVPEPAFRRYLNPGGPAATAAGPQPEAPSPLLLARGNPSYAGLARFHDGAPLYDAEAHDARETDEGDDDAVPMIPMQTYRNGRPVPRRGPASRGSDASSEAGQRAMAAAAAGEGEGEDASSNVVLVVPPGVRQREPRENSDFLRVVVLEMNMRRVGKLDARKAGRARIWLPPRQVVEGVEDGEGGEEGDERARVPARWVAVTA